MNRAINKTMSRTIITGVTTLLTTLVLMIFGGEVLRGFAFALFIGIIVGTYSSIFVASAFVLEVATRANKKVQF
jgi:preprotein translocase subunit SecF